MSLFETIFTYFMFGIVLLFFIAFVINVFETIGKKLEEGDKFEKTNKK